MPLRYEPNDTVRLKAEVEARNIYYRSIALRLPPGRRNAGREECHQNRDEIIAELAADLLRFHSMGYDAKS